MYVYRNTVRRSRNHCCSRNEILHFWVFSTLLHKRNDFGKNFFEYKICILISLQLLYKIFLTEEEFTKISHMYTCLYVKVPAILVRV
jgi:hypothetical protein